MNVRDLIALLEDFDPESPVHVATQPQWPLALAIVNVSELSDREDEEAAPVVWIATDGHPEDLSPYAPEEAWG